MSEQSLIVINNLHLKYGNNHILKGITVDINPGEIYALVGEHGSGKSSLARVLSGFTPILQGGIHYKGKLHKYHSYEKAIVNEILLVPQSNFGFDNLSVAENIFMQIRKKGCRIFSAAKQRDLAKGYFDDLGVTIDPSIMFSDLSLSDRVFVYILKQIYAKPEILILDESLEKLSIENLEIIIPLLQKMVKNGSSIILVTHKIDDIFKLAKDLIILREGKIVFKGTLEDIDKMSLIRLAYMQLTKEEIIGGSGENLTDILKYNEAILTKLPLHLFIVDTNFNIRLINNKAKKLLKLTAKIGRNLNFKDVFSDHPEFLKLVLQAVDQHEEVTIDNISFMLEANKVNMNIKVVPVFELTNYIGSIITLEDITKQERLRSQVMLSENLAAVGMLAAGVAHEINNPLEMINYSLQDLKYRDEKNKFTKELNSLEDEMNSIASIVKNLVVFSDNNSLNIQRFSINKLVKDITRLMKFKAQESKIEFHINFAEEEIFVEANKIEIRQVLLNLLKNSFEAMTGGGLVSIDIKVIAESQVEILFTDQGGGIILDNPSDIFLPFCSTKNDDSRNTGLGLSISYNLIKNNNGELSFENNPPIGCRFRITLPRAF